MNMLATTTLPPPLRMPHNASLDRAQGASTQLRAITTQRFQRMMVLAIGAVALSISSMNFQAMDLMAWWWSLHPPFKRV